MVAGWAPRVTGWMHRVTGCPHKLGQQPLTAYSPSSGHAWELLEHPVRVVHRRTVLLEQLLRRMVGWWFTLIRRSSYNA